MSDINDRLIKYIDEVSCEENIREFIKQLLFIELRNFNNNYPRYGEDYERIIINTTKKRRDDGEI